MKTRRRAGIAMSALVLVAATAACNSSDSDDDGASGDATAVAVVTGLDGFGGDRIFELVNNSKAVWDQIYDYAISQAPSGELAPGLATKWTASPDKLTWTFEFRDDVIFHNGDPFTAEDAAWSWNRTIFTEGSKVSLAGYADRISSIKAVSDTELQIVTKEPEGSLPLWFTQTDGSLGGTIYDSKYFEKVGPDEASAHPVGTGPFEFVSAQGEQEVTVKAFDDPNRGEWQKERTAGFQEIKFMAVPNAATRIALLKSGRADIVPVTITDMSQLEGASGVRTKTVENSNYSGAWCLGFTLDTGSPCDDASVRQAISIAIDRPTIADSLYGDHARPSAAFFGGPGSIGYPDDLEAPAYDPDKAKQLLSDAGYGPDNPLKLQIVTYEDDADFPKLPTLAQAMVGNLKDVGIHASVQIMDWDRQKQLVADLEFPGMPKNDSVSPVTLFMRGQENRGNLLTDQFNSFAYGGTQSNAWNYPGQIAQFEKINEAFTDEERNAGIAAYDHFMADEWAQFPLLASDSGFGLSDRIGDWTPVVGKPYVYNLWTLQPAS